MWFSRNGHNRDIRLLDQIYRLLDKEEKNLVADIGVPICIPGYGKCCEINSIIVKGVEARYIALWLSRQRADFQERIKRLCVDWLTEKHHNVVVYAGLGTGRMSSENIDGLQNDVAQLIHRTPCPMLDENKRCLIHPVRPLACRTYGVTRVVPVDVCPRPTGKNEEGIMRAFRRSENTERVKNLIDELQAVSESKYMQNNGFIAARLLVELDVQKFLDLAYHNYIASAKLAQLGGRALLWQEQLDEDIDRASEISLVCHPVPRIETE